MTLLYEAVDQKKFDTRLVERNLARGVVTHAESQQNIQSLPDDAANAEFISVESIMNDGALGADSSSDSDHH